MQHNCASGVIEQVINLAIVGHVFVGEVGPPIDSERFLRCGSGTLRMDLGRPLEWYVLSDVVPIP
jgi:hypothetical protein